MLEILKARLEKFQGRPLDVSWDGDKLTVRVKDTTVSRTRSGPCGIFHEHAHVHGETLLEYRSSDFREIYGRLGHVGLTCADMALFKAGLLV